MRALALGFAVVATGCADAFSASGAASSVVMSPSSLQLRGSCARQALVHGTAGSRFRRVAAKGARVRMSQNTMESAKQFYPATESTLTAEQVHDRQWELNKYNFRAQWECDMTWYSRSTDATTTNQALRVADASSMAMCGCTMHLLPTAGSTDTRCASLPRICGRTFLQRRRKM